MQFITPATLFVTICTLLCIVTSAPSKKPSTKGDICLNKCDSRNFQCSNDCKFPISKNRRLLFDCVRGCKTTQNACVLECADEGGIEIKASNKQNGGGNGEGEAQPRNKSRSSKLSRRRKTKKAKKQPKELGGEEPEYNIESNQTEPWWMKENSGLGWLLELMEL